MLFSYWAISVIKKFWKNHDKHFKPNVKNRHVEMQNNSATTSETTTLTTTTETFIPTGSIVTSTTTFTSSPATSITSVTSNTTTSIPTTDPTFWDENRITIIIVLCVAIVLLILFIILLALFIKWKEKRRTEGTYNPSRAEKQEHQKNKLVFSIPLPTPERLI